MTRKLTPPHRRWSHGDRKLGQAGRDGKKIPFVKLPPRVEVDNYKASYLRM
jgi:hypothetical protein